MALDFNPLDFFKEEIKNEAASIKISAVSRLHLIASALGPQRSVSELIPFVIECLTTEPHCNDEEFLFTVAKQFASISPYINNQVEMLMNPLEHLAAQEETVIRDQAVTSLCSIVEKRQDLVPDHLEPILHRLATKSDFFTARVSACKLFPTTYRYAKDEQKEKLRKAYVAICADDTPMVRRAAANKMKDLVSVCTKEAFLADLIGVYTTLSQEDTQDNIRVACVNTTLVLAKMFSSEQNRQHTVSVIKEASEDRSWRVRLTVAKNFDQLCEAVDAEIRASHFMPNLITLMKDHEQEVRKEAVRIIEPCLQRQLLTSDQIMTHILPQFAALALDASQPVRAALAQVLGPVCRSVGQEQTQKLLLPLISDLMKDEFHEVRLNIVSHAGLICEVLKVDGLVHSLLHTIQSLIMDNHWRIRQSVVRQVPKLARLFGVDMFQSKLEHLFLSSLRDSVYSVRETCIFHLREISEIFGAEWTVEHLVPKIMEQYSQSIGYANRVTTLQVLPQLCYAMNPSQIEQHIVPPLLRATQDSVPNVRFSACKVILHVMSEHKLRGQAVKKELAGLENDSDIDVQYYALQALHVAQAA